MAGGMGDLSWELHNVNHFTSTVMDPRPLDHKYSIRKLKARISMGADGMFSNIVGWLVK